MRFGIKFAYKFSSLQAVGVPMDNSGIPDWPGETGLSIMVSPGAWSTLMTTLITNTRPYDANRQKFGMGYEHSER